MVIGLLRASISVPESRSLKDKRRVVRSIRDRVMHRMNVSVAEVSEQGQWKFAELAFVTVAAESSVVQKRLSELASMLEFDGRFVLVDISTEFL